MPTRALVTGAAGFIGSTLTERLLADGAEVTGVDCFTDYYDTALKRRNVSVALAHPRFRLLELDLGEADLAALPDVDVVFHQAAYGGYMPEIAKFVEVNSLGTARLLEMIRDDRLPVRKVVVASSQAVYREGAATCPAHGAVDPLPRADADMRAGVFAPRCPRCGGLTAPAPTPESATLGGENVYAITKVDQERLTLAWSRQTGIPAVALRYSCTYGPRQSLLNPYTGLIAIFATRILNGLPPVLYEDGRQTRDLVFVEDVARANLIAATSDALDGLPVNVGSGIGTAVGDIDRLVGEALESTLVPEMRGEFRPGEMRHLRSDIGRARGAGWEPTVSLGEGIGRYLAWVATQGEVAEYFGAAEGGLRARGVVQTSA